MGSRYKNIFKKKYNINIMFRLTTRGSTTMGITLQKKFE